MPPKRDALTSDRLREVLNYDPDSGLFTWKSPTGRRAKVGSVAGTVIDGRKNHPTRRPWRYRQIGVDGTNYKAHRLAWLYVHNKWPSDEIDHIDGDGSNNRIANLREATRAENSRNAPKRRNNTSGYKGVWLNHGRWSANIWTSGRKISLGTYDTPEQAHAAYAEAAKKLHDKFARV